MEGVSDTLEITNEREAWALVAQHLKKHSFNRTELESSRILTLLSRLKPLQALSYEQRLALTKLMKFSVAKENDVLFNINDRVPVAPGVYDGQEFTIVVHGCVKHTFQTVNGRVTRELYAHDYFGVPSVTASIPSTSSYVAIEPTELVSFSMEHFHKHLAFLDEDEITQRVHFFKNVLVVPILASWSDDQFEALARSVYPMRYQSRSVSVREGDKADSVFFIVQGKMKVVREVDFSAAHGEPCAKMLELATLTPGEYYGELALLRFNVDEHRRPKKRELKQNSENLLLDDDVDEESEFDVKALNKTLQPIPRQATVYAHTPSEVLVLPRDRFIDLVQGSALVRVQEYAKGYPSQAEVRAHYLRQQKWSGFKDQVMTQVISGSTSITMPSPNSTKPGARR